VFFKMRVAGVLHIFQFETKQGEDICMALQTHINDIMMKRYSKAKAAQEGGGDAGGEPERERERGRGTCAAGCAVAVCRGDPLPLLPPVGIDG
jgi:hypothetical protein